MSDNSALDGSRKRKRTRSPSEPWPTPYRERTDQPPSLTRPSNPQSKPAKTFTSRADVIRSGSGSKPVAYSGRQKYVASNLGGQNSKSQLPSRPSNSLPKAPLLQPKPLVFPAYPTFPGSNVPSHSPKALDPAELGPPRSRRTSRLGPFDPFLPLPPLETPASRQSLEPDHLTSPATLPSASQLPPLPSLAHSSTDPRIHPKSHDLESAAGEVYRGRGTGIVEAPVVQNGAKKGDSQRDEARENVAEAGNRIAGGEDNTRESIMIQKRVEIDVDQREEERSIKKSEKEQEFLWISSDSEEEEEGNTRSEKTEGGQVKKAGTSTPQLKSSDVESSLGRQENLARSAQHSPKRKHKNSPRSSQRFKPLNNNAARKSAPSPQRQKRKFSSISSSRFFSGPDKSSRSGISSSISDSGPENGVRKSSSTQPQSRREWLLARVARKSAPAPAQFPSSSDDDEDDDESDSSDPPVQIPHEAQQATSPRDKDSLSPPSRQLNRPLEGSTSRSTVQLVPLPIASADPPTDSRTSTVDTRSESPSASTSFRSNSTPSAHPATDLLQREDVSNGGRSRGGTMKESSEDFARRETSKETKTVPSSRERSREVLSEEIGEDENMGGDEREVFGDAEVDEEEHDILGKKAKSSLRSLAEEAQKFLPEVYDTVGTSERKLRKRSLNGGVLVSKPRAISSDLSEMSTKTTKKKSLVKEAGERKTWLELLKIDQQPRIEVPADWEPPPQPWLVEDPEDSINDCIHKKQVLFKLDKLVLDARHAESILDSSKTTLTLRLESHNTIHGFPPTFTLASNVVPFIFSLGSTTDRCEESPADSSTALVPDLSHPLASHVLSLALDPKICRKAGTVSIDLLLSLQHNLTVFETRYNLCSVPSPIQPLIPRSTTSQFLSFNGTGSVFGMEVTIDVVPLRKKHLSADETQLEIERRLARMSLDRGGIWVPDAQAVRREGHELKEIKMIDLGKDGKYGYNFLTKLPYRTGEVVRDWHHDTPENTAHWVRIKDDEISRSDAKAPEKLLARAHMRWGLLNPYPPSVYDSEVTCWVHYAPLVHHFSLRFELGRLLLGHHLKHNLLTEKEIRKVLNVYDLEKEKIEKGARRNYEQLRREAKWSERRV